jgi:TRAP-type C4-dicarboxylate transport system substrate-binding protein
MKLTEPRIFIKKGGGIMKRLSAVFVLALSVLLACLTGFSQPASAAAPQLVELKFGTGTAGNDALGIFNKNWMKQLEKNTNGRVKMTWLGDGVIGPNARTEGLTVAGTYDIGETGTGNRPNSLHDVVSLPFIAPRILPSSMAAHGLSEVEKAIQDEYKDVKLLFFGTRVASHIFTTKKAIRSMDDFKGLKIQVINAPMADMVKSLGGVPLRLDNSEVYSSLERGILDGAMYHWNLAFGYKLGEICKYGTMLDISRSCGVWFMNMNKWNSLPPDIQKAIMDISGYKGAADVANHFAEAEADLIKQVTASSRGNLQIINLPQAERDKMTKLLSPQWDKWVKDREAEGKPGKRVLETFLKLQDKYAKEGK